ncbi:MAG: aldehyde dehydrogenase family protein [Phototrophicaceae bacterium]
MTKIQKTISPIDGSVYVERELASSQEIEKVLQSAQDAQTMWRNTSLSERVEICEKMVQYMLENVDAIAEEITRQMGRPIRYTPYEITGGFQERARYMMSIAETSLADIQASDKSGFTRFIRREPLGTVFVLAPWNYPFLTSVNSIIPALIAGNTVILKHSDQTPLVAERYSEAFASAGLPAGVFQHLHITHDDVAEIIDDSRIDFVAFTGSVSGGHAIQNATSSRFISAGLELGGKDPAYIRSDANLQHSIENVIDGAFFNSGQSCCGIERIYVHEDVYDDFIDGAVTLTKQYILGNPLDEKTTLGPMVRTRSADFARQQIDDAISQGAVALIPSILFPENKADSPYLAPQILVNVTHDMSVMQEESFAPVVGIMKVNSDEQAIQLMNDSEFGLTASIWTEDVDRALSIGNQVNAGTWYMNRCDYLDPELAWTGVKNSGRGCTLSVLGYDSLTRPKSFHLRTL